MLLKERHIKSTLLLKYVAEVVPARKSKKIADHLARCDECRQKAARMERLVASTHEKAGPSEEVKARIIASFHRQQDALSAINTAYHGKSISYARRIKIAASLAVVCAAIIVSYLFFQGEDTSTRVPRIDLIAYKGPVYINDRQVTHLQTFGGEGCITVGANAYARVAYQNRLVITLAGNSVFRIVKAAYSGAGRQALFAFKLDHGLLFSNAEAEEGRFSYGYTTPHLALTPLGTRFMLEAGENDSRVLVRQGTVLLSSLRDHTVIVTKPDTKYIAAEHITTAPVTDKDIDVCTALLHNPGHLYEKKPAISEENISEKTDQQAVKNRFKANKKEMREWKREQRTLRSNKRNIRSKR